jgi:hypothetical protein
LRSVESRLASGAATITVGLMLLGTSHPDAGGAVLLAGWVLLAASVHSFGRSGPA